jgi:hypothetical protein
VTHAFYQNPAGKTRTETLDEAVRAQATGTHITIGLTTKCSYGLGACWAGAYEALRELNGVAAVRPIANTEDSTAEVYLRDEGLPDLSNWTRQFAYRANRSYDFRGVEVTLIGTVRSQAPENSSYTCENSSNKHRAAQDTAVGAAPGTEYTPGEPFHASWTAQLRMADTVRAHRRAVMRRCWWSGGRGARRPPRWCAGVPMRCSRPVAGHKPGESAVR